MKFYNLFCKSWKTPFRSDLISTYFDKLKSVKCSLKSWNEEVFGNTSQYICSCENPIKSFESLLDTDAPLLIFIVVWTNPKKNVTSFLNRRKV